MNTPQIAHLPTREAWLEARRQGIGSSDAPIILGVSRWGSPLSLYHEKRGVDTREPETGPTDMRTIGLLAEPLIAELFTRDTGRAVHQPPPHSIWINPAAPCLRTSIDRFQYDNTRAVDAQAGPEEITEELRGILELKNVSVYEAAHWLETGEVPVEYVIQVQHQLNVTGAPYASIAALIGGSQFRWADIPRDEELIALLTEQELEFWDRVQQGHPPEADASDATRRTLRRLAPQLDVRTVALPPDFIELDERRSALQAEIKDRAEELQGIDNQIVAFLTEQNGNAGTLANGVTYTWTMQSRKEYTAKATTFPVLRRKGAK